MKIELKFLDNRLKFENLDIPKYATTGSAGIDLTACIDNDLIILPGERKLISTGISINIKNKNVAGLIIPRSGLGHKNGIILGNSIGLIDSDYQGEILISCWNTGDNKFIVHFGDRIAQLVFIPILQAKFIIKTDFTPTSRNNKGFGHTGVSSVKNKIKL